MMSYPFSKCKSLHLQMLYVLCWISRFQARGRVGYTSLVLVRMCRRKSKPIHIPIFQEKVTHSFTNQPNFAPNSPDFFNFSKIFLNLSPNCAKFFKIDPFIYQILYFIKGSFIYQEADFAVGSFVPQFQAILITT